jgi:hypothetical protein
MMGFMLCGGIRGTLGISENIEAEGATLSEVPVLLESKSS